MCLGVSKMCSKIFFMSSKYFIWIVHVQCVSGNFTGSFGFF
jgi:hypothetical protein